MISRWDQYWRVSIAELAFRIRGLSSLDRLQFEHERACRPPRPGTPRPHRQAHQANIALLHTRPFLEHGPQVRLNVRVIGPQYARGNHRPLSCLDQDTHPLCQTNEFAPVMVLETEFRAAVERRQRLRPNRPAHARDGRLMDRTRGAGEAIRARDRDGGRGCGGFDADAGPELRREGEEREGSRLLCKVNELLRDDSELFRGAMLTSVLPAGATASVSSAACIMVAAEAVSCRVS